MQAVLLGNYLELTNIEAVFRAAHDSAKGVRTWMTDLKKK